MSYIHQNSYVQIKQEKKENTLYHFHLLKFKSRVMQCEKLLQLQYNMFISLFTIR